MIVPKTFQKVFKKPVSWAYFIGKSHSVHWGINPNFFKNIPSPLFCQAPFKYANCQSPTLFRQSPLYLGFLGTPLKIRFFSEPK